MVLQTVAREKLASALADPDFCQLLDRLVQAKRQAASEPAWFQEKYPQAPLTCVAYFCMEFMLSEALPIYSGGYAYRATVSSARSATDFTARITASHDALAQDVEAGWMLWQK